MFDLMTSALTEARIVLPLYDNEGRDLSQAIATAEDVLLCDFGGFSRVMQEGAWRNPETGKVYRDVAYSYAIAADWNDDGNVSALFELATDLAAIMGQDCIYVALPSGVHFVEPLQVAA